MEQINIMEEVIKMLLEFLRKQAFAVVVLVAGLVGTGYLAREQKQEFSVQLVDLRIDLRKCGEAREAREADVAIAREADITTIRDLSVKLATVTARVDILSRRK